MGSCLNAQPLSSTELDLLHEVLEIEILDNLKHKTERKKIWVRPDLNYICLPRKNGPNDLKAFRQQLGLTMNGINPIPSDSLYMETHFKYNFGDSGLDKEWDYAMKRAYVEKMYYNCQATIHLSKRSFKSRKIKFRKKNFNTWGYGNPIVLNNGEFVIFNMGFVCGTLCSESGTVIYQKVDGKWVKLRTLVIMS